MIQLNKKIVLGSGSPRRQLLLKELGLNFRTLISDTAEIPIPGLMGRKIAEYLSDEKAEALKNKINKDEILITADTIVWLNSHILNKPANSEEAFNMLSSLSGRKHQVYTGVTIINASTKKTFSVESSVVFKILNENEIRKYISEFKPYDKAGSYGAQECLSEGINPCSENEIKFLNKYQLDNFFEKTLAPEKKKHIPMIDHIDGSYYNVMGLPIVELMEELFVIG